MKTKPTDEDTKTKIVDFTCHAPEAEAVFLAGTFNSWSPESLPLVRDKTGNWRTSLSLPFGHHEFKFIVDGQWCCEPGCEGEYHGCPKCVPNEHGTMNQVLEVGEELEI
jgi:5'-AMP-activated protein kinase regulatory beta subunit